MAVKQAVLAGTWYPETANECEREIKNWLATVQSVRNTTGTFYSACISPHAGWYYSGAISCQVIQAVSNGEKPDVVAVFGKHLPRNAPVSILKGAECETPFGYLKTDDLLSEAIGTLPGVFMETPDRFASENTIEIQLPFIRYFFGDIKVLIIGAPPNDASIDLGAEIVRLAAEQGKKIKFIGSTDMTHYGSNFGFTPAGPGKKAVEWVKNENDRKMIDAMVAMDAPTILHEAAVNQNACCSGAVAATVSAAAALGKNEGTEIAYATSYDKSPGESFVGYAGVVY